MSTGNGEPGITVDGVWKKFRKGERHDSLRDLIPNLVRAVAGRRPDPAALEALDFWALRDINLEIRPGHAVGIIGHNGAGKSTLLKLITKIMRPTLGRCEVRGRVGALIELAAGFHQDLTGRENIFLQGAIMGMPAAAIRARFDQIVEFSGISEFIDTPVKRFSSGMNARLGFSIAAHLEPEVMIIDEVLSVGDLAFQERAFGRMRELVQSGIPVAVVSHQLDRIRSLCTEAVLLQSGQVVYQGSPEECIATYVRTAVKPATEVAIPIPGLEFHAMELAESGPIRSGERRSVRVTGAQVPVDGSVRRLGIGWLARSLQSGQVVYQSTTARHGVVLQQEGPFTLDLDLQFNLAPGLYVVEVWAIDADRERGIGKGPTMQVAVEHGAPFFGVAQLNPRILVRQEPASRGA